MDDAIKVYLPEKGAWPLTPEVLEGAKEKFRQLLDEYPGGKAAKTASDFLAKLGDE